MLGRAGLCVAAGAAAYAFAARRPSWLAEGAFVGAAASGIGFFAARWLVIAHAWSMMDWFSGRLLQAAIPFLVGGSLALICVARGQEELWPIRARLAVSLLAGWAASQQLAMWRLRTAYGFGPSDLARAATVPSESQAPLVGVAWLHPSTAAAAGYSVETRRAAVDGVDIEGESLVGLYGYLKARDYRGIFVHDALAALRQGWLFWWDADRALEAAMLNLPGRVHPDYLTALALLRAGPVTVERFQKLRALSDMGRDRRAGFEDVNRSQLIFEAFSAAFARFGDEEDARAWLFKVDNLWPIYEKKVEAAPVENFHDGRISGVLAADGRRPASLLVGLFLVSTSSGATVERSTPALSQSDFPDARGRFMFRDLGAGTYFLGVQGAPDVFRGAIQGSPGYLTLSPERPAVRIEAIRVVPVTKP